jgi:hypothetical protein
MKRQRIAIVTVMAVVVLATAFGFGQSTQAQTTNQLAGTYRLITSKTTVLATGEVTHPLGKSQGYIMYGRDGRMMILQVAEKRPQPKDLATITDQERIDLFKTMVAYSGTYDFDGKVVTHHIDVSWNGIKGSPQREVKLDGRKLVLTYTGPNVATGVVGTVELI